MSTFFWMLTMWAYLQYVKQPSVARYLLTLLAFALGLMAKPMLVTLPFVLLLLDYWPLARVPSKRAVGKTDRQNKEQADTPFYRQILYYLIWEKIPFFVLSAVSSVVTFLVQRSGGAMAELVVFPLKIRIFNALISYMEYIWKMIWPVHLAVFYPHPGQNISILYAIISTVLLLAITVLIFRFAKNHRYLLTGWFWYLGTLVPVIGLVQVGVQALADRYTYITLTGLFIIIAWGLPDLLAKWRYRKIALTLSALLIILAMSICTHFQLRHWQNSLTLYQHALDVTEDNHCIMRLNLAEYLCKQNMLDEAIRECRKCLQIIPDSQKALDYLGIALGKQGKYDEAIKCFTKVLRINPDSFDAHINMSHALALQGNLEEAAVHLAEALRLDPHSAQAHHHLGRVLAQTGKIDEAIQHYRQVLRYRPNGTTVYNSLKVLLAIQKKSAAEDRTPK